MEKDQCAVHPINETLNPLQGYDEDYEINSDAIHCSSLNVQNNKSANSGPNSLVEQLTLFVIIGIFASIGAYTRVGFSYIQVWKIETNYNSHFYNTLGCVIMGFATKHKKYFFDEAQSKLYKFGFVSITSALCGSVTSFSSVQMECNKSFFLQWDSSWGNAFASSTGAKFYEWLLCMLSTVAIPLVGFHFGQHLALLSPIWKQPRELSISTERKIFVAIIGISGAIFLLIILLATVAYPKHSFIAYTSVFATVGAYARYRLSLFNPRYPTFPVGTFVANISGTWLLAIITVWSRFVVDYYDTRVQAVLFGLSFGFCGCLSTVSTLVKEIDELPVKSAYVYSVTTSLVAQIGIILLYNSFTYTTIPLSGVFTDSINICTESKKMCKDFLSLVNCSQNYILNNPCSNMQDYDTYRENMCQCGSFSSNYFSELLVDSQIKSNVASRSVSVWPNKPEAFDDPTQSYDICLTYNSLCEHYFNRIACPEDLKSVNSCSHSGIFNGEWQCSCGGHVAAGYRLLELITDVSLSTRYDLIPYTGYATVETIDFEQAYLDVCDKMLDHVNCNIHSREIKTNAIKGNYSTWDSKCECGNNYDVNTLQISKAVFDAVVNPMLLGLLVKSSDTEVMGWDVCKSYDSICGYFLNKIACPTELKMISSCYNSDPELNGTVMAFSGLCRCGKFKDITDRVLEGVIDSLLAQSIRSSFWYIQQPHAAYTEAIGTSPFKQFLLKY